MGVDIGDIVVKHEIQIKELNQKVVAIDGFNTLYQFISIIRQRDGTPLQDRQGRPTSHLSGILYRVTNLVEEGVKPIFVFDGDPPEFKYAAIADRSKLRKEMEEKWKSALASGAEDAFKYAQASGTVDDHVITTSKTLLSLMGIPFVDAPSEGEAQAAYMTAKGDAHFTASQDYDSLLFGTPKLVRNLTITGKRKLPGRNVYVTVRPQVVHLKETLTNLDLSREQLIDIALLVGTDYNKGIKGIGPKKALDLIKKYGDIESSVKAGKLHLSPEEMELLFEIREYFLNPPVTDDYEIKWKRPERDGIIRLLCDEYDFSEDRVTKAIDRLEEGMDVGQKTLDQWFG
jgi:flap endonuclease-1